MKAKEKKALRKTADALLETVKEMVDTYVLVGNVDALNRLVTQVNILSGYELIKVFRDKGLSSDITALADKAGRIVKATSTS